ncbi:MAG: DUF488 family protein [Candidatus Aminicenantia bacterium]
MEIWDIGHSNRSFDNFLNILRKNNIELLVDVRRFPGSKKFPHFNRDFLQSELPKHGIEYTWQGEKLGGFRKGGYEKWLETEEFSKGIAVLEKEASNKRTAIMCAEGYFKRCHRRYIIEILENKDWQVIHL